MNIKHAGLGLRMVPAVMLLTIAIMVLSSCAGGYSKDPDVAFVQKWTDTCGVYGRVLKGINDSLELQVIDKDSTVVSAFKPVFVTLQPICAEETPPGPELDPTNYKAILNILDKQLIEEIKRRKGITNG